MLNKMNSFEFSFFFFFLVAEKGLMVVGKENVPRDLSELVHGRKGLLEGKQMNLNRQLVSDRYALKRPIKTEETAAVYILKLSTLNNKILRTQ